MAWQKVNAWESIEVPMASNTKTKPETLPADIDDGQEPKPKNAFARNLRDRMAKRGLSIEQLAELVTSKGEVQLTKQRVKYLRSVGLKELGSTARKGGEVLAIAETLGCNPEDLFADEIPVTAPVDESEKQFVDMVKKGLEGPKANFLKDAIEMAYSAALTSLRR